MSDLSKIMDAISNGNDDKAVTELIESMTNYWNTIVHAVKPLPVDDVVFFLAAMKALTRYFEKQHPRYPQLSDALVILMEKVGTVTSVILPDAFFKK